MQEILPIVLDRRAQKAIVRFQFPVYTCLQSLQHEKRFKRLERLFVQYITLETHIT